LQANRIGGGIEGAIQIVPECQIKISPLRSDLGKYTMVQGKEEKSEKKMSHF
jgi:hypothetical protein